MQNVRRKLHVGPPIGCDAIQTLPGTLLRALHWHSGFCASCFHCALPCHRCAVTGVLQGSPGARKDHTQPVDARGWLKGAGWSRKSGKSDAAVPRGAAYTKQYDVCYRDWYSCVPTRTAAQLGVYVPARHTERRFWCVQSWFGHFSSGHEQLQAQRSRSELQLSQQLLPPEEWGRVGVMLRYYNALKVKFNNSAEQFGGLQHQCFVESFSTHSFLLHFKLSLLRPWILYSHSLQVIFVAHTVNLTCMPSLGHTVASRWYEYVFCTLV